MLTPLPYPDHALPPKGPIGRIKKQRTPAHTSTRKRTGWVVCLPKGYPVRILDNQRKWMQIECMTNKGMTTGWIRSKYVVRK